MFFGIFVFKDWSNDFYFLSFENFSASNLATEGENCFYYLQLGHNKDSFFVMGVFLVNH